jgi:hypothetical protein
MTFRPTKKRQQDWIRQHLNDGVYPLDRKDPFWTDDDWRMKLACRAAMRWLADSDIKTLAEAWEECRRPDWMLWTLYWMEPDESDAAKARTLLFRADLSASVFAHNPQGLILRIMQVMIRNCPTKERRVNADRIRELWGNPWRL